LNFRQKSREELAGGPGEEVTVTIPLLLLIKSRMKITLLPIPHQPPEGQPQVFVLGNDPRVRVIDL
jgi:hypothetical protein